jgi:hypothetical protein
LDSKHGRVRLFKARKSQGKPGKARKSQEKPGKARKSQEKPGKGALRAVLN